MADFDWMDPLLIEEELSEEERMVRDSARRFCQSELLPHARDDFRYERFERTTMEAMGRMGFLGATLPEELGGAGLNHVSYGFFVPEVGRGGYGHPLLPLVHSSLA